MKYFNDSVLLRGLLDYYYFFLFDGNLLTCRCIIMYGIKLNDWKQLINIVLESNSYSFHKNKTNIQIIIGANKIQNRETEYYYFTLWYGNEAKNICIRLGYIKVWDGYTFNICHNFEGVYLLHIYYVHMHMVGIHTFIVILL